MVAHCIKLKMENLNYDYKNVLITYCVILLIVISCGVNCGADADQRQQQSQGDRIRVLIVSNADRRHAIEEASSLSLDLPQAQPTSRHQLSQKQQQQQQLSTNTNENETTTAAAATTTLTSNQSLATGQSYKQQHSLAALTLNQRQRSDERRDGGAGPRQNDVNLKQQQHQQQQQQQLNNNTNRLLVATNELTGSSSASASASAIARETVPTVTTTTTTTLRQHEHSAPLALGEIDLPRTKPSWLNVSSRYKITGSSIEEVAYMMPPEYYLRQAFDAPVLLKTKLGIVEGVRSIKFNKHLYTFLSVPYAKPPVDGLRFRAPQPIDRWDGVLQTTKWPPFCVQPSMTLASKSSPVHPLTQMMSEDCLYLNIWTPSLKFNKNNQYKRPVMVWIHGGAFQYGGISVDENDGSALALAGNVVVVTLNYRISAFGFLNANNHDNGPNNVGLLDQRLAMQWVQENIRQFGGDPQQVTLFGESAGGHSVGLHMISPGSHALFKRAIMQSGVPISFLRSYDVNSDNNGSMLSEAVSSVMMAKRLKCYNGANATTAALAANEESSAATNADGNGDGNGDEDDEENDESADDATATAAAAASAAAAAAEAPILSDQELDCMRQKSSLEILKAMGAPGNAGFFPTGNDPRGFFPNGPIMDSFDAEAPKIGPQKEYLIGTNVDEGTFMLHYGMPALFPSRASPRVSSIEQLKLTLQEEIERISREANGGGSGSSGSNGTSQQQQSSSSTTAEDIRSASGASNGGAQAHLYRPLLRTSTTLLESFMPKSPVQILKNGTTVYEGKSSAWTRETEFGKNVGSLITDIIFLCPARTLAQTLSNAGRNVYYYMYSHRSSMTPYHDWLGVTHHDEVEFVFGRPLRLADVYSGADIEMSQRLIKIWSHFAYTGQALRQFNVDWPKYGAEDHNYMNLQPGEASVGQRYHDRVCNVYDTVISVHLKNN